MNIERLLTSSALRSAAFVLASAAFAAPAYAQAVPNAPAAGQPTPDEETTPEEDSITEGEVARGDVQDDGTILITGSRIRRPEFSGVLPGVQVDEQTIETRGFTNALDVLTDIPLVGTSTATFNGNAGGQAASLGAAFADLLDLGTNRTLTLVNSRRFVSGNSATLFVAENATGSQVDLNMIPVQLIERIDVLTVGGAAAYGADAIAGVVNIILKDEFVGTEVDLLGGISERGDSGQYTVNAIHGTKLLNDRLNLIISGEYNWNDGLQADARDFRQSRFTNIPNFLSGGVRNPAFAPAIIDVTGANNGAFLRASDDLVSSSLFASGAINVTLSNPGSIFNVLSVAPAQNGIGAPALSFFNTALQIIPGIPTGNGLGGATAAPSALPITIFAPTSLPTGVTASQVFAQFGVTPPAGANPTQLNTLAINVLQANRPTPREFFAANPTVDVNAFIGTFNPSVPRIPNTDTRLVNVRGVQVPLNQVLPFVAVPLVFNDDGSIRQATLATLDPTTPSTYSQAIGANAGFLIALKNTVLRVQQERKIANLVATFDITDDLEFFTENLYAHVESTALNNSPSGGQTFFTTGVENAALVVNVNNPFLDAQDRAALASAGITSAFRNGNFVVTRQNQDLFEGGNPLTNTTEAFRTSTGLRADFELFGRGFNAEVSGTYGRATQHAITNNVRDIEFQLAVDAVLDPATNTIRCRSQLNPAAFIGTTPGNVSSNLTRVIGADGIPTEVISTPTITAEQITACQPLNPFGFNQMSQASKDYVTYQGFFHNVSRQIFLQSFLAGSLFDLPAGPLGFSVAGEYRKEMLDFTADELNRLGRGRSAPSAQTHAFIEALEGGVEVRIPITSEDFLPFLGDLELTPAYRVVKQNGQAETFRNLAGNLVTPTAKGDWESIWSIAGTWRPIRDITFRGNITRSIRQPSIVELFLGGQPSFAAPTEVCSAATITQGPNPDIRRANCIAAVTAAGVVLGNGETPEAFLASFVPQTGSLAGTFTGAPGLAPERGRSKTAGVMLTPRFIPGLSLSADYIHVDLLDQIQVTGLAAAMQLCYDSPTFPDTSPQTGANTCTFFTRGTNFQIQPGYGAGFINLAATRIRSWNFSGTYNFDLPSNWGRIDLRGNAYYLKKYEDSAVGDFSDAIRTHGVFTRPKWRTQLSGRYSGDDGFYTQLTWSWRSKTRLFSNGTPQTAEDFPAFIFPDVSLIDLAVGFEVDKRYTFQFLVQNLTDNQVAGATQLFVQQPAGTFLDQIGRRFQASARMSF